MADNLEQQKDELMALDSILSCNDDGYSSFESEGLLSPIPDEDTITPTISQHLPDPPGSTVILHKGQIRICVPLERKLKIQATFGQKVKTADLEHVPPLYVSFLLSADYPSTSPPSLHFASVWLDDEMVRHLVCLADKCSSLASPQQVREAVQNEQLPSCQKPVLLERDGESIIITMATCAACDLVFCAYCRKVYHGISECTFSSAEQGKLVVKYKDADPDQKLIMEQRYGKRTLQRLVDNFVAEDWIKDNCKKCPVCNSNIEKRDGCNKMWCRKCGSSFCWLCLTVLSHMDPYRHFNSPRGSCYNKLFMGVALEDDEEWF